MATLLHFQRNKQWYPIFWWIGKNRNDFNIAENSCYHSWLATCLSPMLTCYFMNEVIPETHGVHYINIDLRHHYYYRVTIPLLVDYEGIFYPVINVSAHIWLITYIVCLRLYMFPLLPVSLDCPFWLPLQYSLMFIYARNFQFLNNVIYRSSGINIKKTHTFSTYIWKITSNSAKDI